tara:strand:- start:1543 stop:2727 length:1185 start_codon:yes stop_codon:yes gene_type:complete
MQLGPESIHGMQKSLDTKLARILADPTCGDFIIADAKDADMAFGIAAPGQSPEHHAQEGRFRSLQEYRQLVRENVQQGLLDIMLTSASTNELLTVKERIFDQSSTTPAARVNDTTDIHLATGSNYAHEPSRPFRTATIDHIMCGHADCNPAQRVLGADLGLYSVTFNNDIERDLETLEAYGTFRIEAETKGFRHFLEVFNPNACGNYCPEDLGRFINDQIARTLAGVVGKGKPIFLKIPYHGPEAMEQLASYDRTLIPGILGGSSGTTFDAFFQLWEAKKHGARAALYGRMINNSEHQASFIQHLRWLADGDLNNPEEAVRSYHAALQNNGVQPYRSIEDDLISTRRLAAYGNTTASPTTTNASTTPTRDPTVEKIPQNEKVKWSLDRWQRVLG